MGRLAATAALLLALGLPHTAAGQDGAGPPSPPGATTVAAPDPRAPTRHRMRPAQVRALEQLIAATPQGDPELPELLFRLADHHDRTADYHTDRAVRAASAGKAKRARTHETAADQSQREALEIYSRLTTDPGFGAYPRRDEALYLYGHLLARRGDMPAARQVYLHLIKNYPQSRYIPDVYLSFGDYYFDEGKMAHAEKFYDQVLRFPNSKLRGYALFKKAWVYLNLGKPIEALESFHKCHQAATAGPLQREARRGFVLAYALVGRPAAARAAFARLSKSDADEMQRQLAQQYLDQGQAAQAIETYRQLMRHNPKAPELCAWQGAVVEATATLGNANLLRKARDDLRALAGRLNSSSCRDLVQRLAP